MKSNTLGCIRAAALAASMIVTVLPAVAHSQQSYSGSQLRKMMREANTPNQDSVLATWFRGQEAVYRAKVEAENRDYERYKTTVRTKAPTRADNARSLADHYSGKASRMAELASGFETQLSRLDPSYRPVTAVSATGTTCPAVSYGSAEN
jgi:hypothetical protein